MRCTALVCLALITCAASCGGESKDSAGKGKKATKPTTKPAFRMTPELVKMKAELGAVVKKVCACSNSVCASEAQRPILRIVATYREVDNSHHILADAHKTMGPCVKQLKAVAAPEEGLKEEAEKQLATLCACKTVKCLEGTARPLQAIRRRGMLSPAAKNVLVGLKFAARLDKCTKAVSAIAPKSKEQVARLWVAEWENRMEEVVEKKRARADRRWPCRADWALGADGKQIVPWRYWHGGPKRCFVAPEFAHLGCPIRAERWQSPDKHVAKERWVFAYDEKGQLAASQRSVEGQPLARSLYRWKAQRLERIETDTTKDGQVNSVETFMHGKGSITAKLDRDGDGKPERTIVYTLSRRRVVSAKHPDHRTAYKWKKARLVSAMQKGKSSATITYAYDCKQK